MTPEDSYWLIQKLVYRFPGLVVDQPVNGDDLIDWLIDQLRRDDTLRQIAKGHDKEVEDELIESQPSLPICPNCQCDDFFVNQDVDKIRCDFCGQVWKALPMEGE